MAEPNFELGFQIEDNRDNIVNTKDNDSAPKVKRFKVVDEEERIRIINGLTSENTKKVTQKSVLLLVKFHSHTAQEQHQTVLGRPLTAEEIGNIPELNLATIQASHLCLLLSQFWLSLRTEKGELYKSNSLQNIRHGINRYIKELKRDFDIIKAPEFAESNLAFKAQVRELKRIGKADTEHHQPLSEADLSKVYAYFEAHIGDSPVALQRKVWFDLTLHLLRRGRENLHELTKDHFSVTTDGSGCRYVHQCLDEATKNHQDDGCKRQGRMYEVAGHALCPVVTYERYVSLLDPDCAMFLQVPEKEVRRDDERWYRGKTLGHNTIGTLMASISSQAGLSLRYTNHCLRTTSVTVLDNAQFPDRHIMTVSGHKSETSLKQYSHHTSEDTKRKMSTTLNRSLGLGVHSTPSTSTTASGVSPVTTCPVPSVNVSEEARTPTVANILPPRSDTWDTVEDVENTVPDNVLASIDIPSLTDNIQNNSWNQSNRWNMPLAPNLSHCNVTINYNITMK